MVFLSRFDNHRSPPVSNSGTGITVQDLHTFLRGITPRCGRWECSPLPATPAVGPGICTSCTFLINNGMQDAGNNYNDRMDDGRTLLRTPPVT